MVAIVLPGFTQDLAVGVTGSTTLQGWENPVTLLRQQPVQRAILIIAEQPQSRSEVDPIFENESYGVDALVNAWVLEERDGKLFINFNLVTKEDGPVLKKIRDRHGRILADELIKRWDTISSALDTYDLETVPRNVLGYILVGAFSLDWDGLALTAEQEWREVAMKRPNGDVFHVWAEVRPEPDALRGLFWGSHNDTRGNVRLTTFGDHYAVPRNGFPDLAWRMNADFQNTDENFQKALYPGSAVVARDGALDWVASAMSVLRDGPVTTDTVAEQIDRPVSRTGYVLEMLKTTGYVDETGDGWVALIPVLDARDVDMTHTVLREGREAMLAWGEANIEEVFTDMEKLTAVRHGVPPEAMMTKVWHHIFAGANSALIEGGYIADPYEKPEQFKGFYPVVWTLDNNPDELVGKQSTEVGQH